MDPASTTLKLLAVLALIAINAFFVAAEFALISSRRSRVEPLARSGHRRAQRVLAASQRVAELVKEAGGFGAARTMEDLAGRPRIVTARRD